MNKIINYIKWLFTNNPACTFKAYEHMLKVGEYKYGR